ncbi:MAG: hypothetical protein D6781_11400, partial [Verrucomicrobia bacterium]
SALAAEQSAHLARDSEQLRHLVNRFKLKEAAAAEARAQFSGEVFDWAQLRSHLAGAGHRPEAAVAAGADPGNDG